MFEFGVCVTPGEALLCVSSRFTFCPGTFPFLLLFHLVCEVSLNPFLISPLSPSSFRLFSSSAMTPSWPFLAFPASSWVASSASSHFPIFSSLPPPSPKHESCTKAGTMQQRGKEQGFLSQHFFPLASKCLRNRALACLAEDNVSKAGWLWISLQLRSVLSLSWEIGPSLAKGPFEVQLWNTCLFLISIYFPQRSQEARKAVPTPGSHQGGLTPLFLSRKRIRVELSFKKINVDLELENNVSFYKKILPWEWFQ